MTIDEWEESGLEPRFGHQGQWLKDDLDRLESPVVAAFALLDGASPEGNTNVQLAAESVKRSRRRS